MTGNQKRLWDLLPPGEWVNRDTVHEQFGRFDFQRSLSWLYTKNFIQLEFKPDPDRPHLTDQFVRRRPIEEIQKL